MSSLKKSIKCVTVGDGVVGKTCMLISYTSNTFSTEFFPRIDTLRSNVVLDGTTVDLTLWDTQGQEDFNRVRALIYRGADVFVIAFSLISKASYRHVVIKWLPELRQHSHCVPIILVGTKLDLRDDEQFLVDYPVETHVTTDQGFELMKFIGAFRYIECSSKTQQNVKEVFESAIKAALQLQTLESKTKMSQRNCTIS